MIDQLADVRLPRHELPGLLITVDGSDGTGKTTLIDGMEQELRARGMDVLRTRQPTTEARDLDAFRVYLFEPGRRAEVDYRALLCMMIGDRLQHIHRVVLPALRAGTTVLCDRYIFTQMVTTRTRGHQDEPWMYELYPHVIAPDIGIITDADLDLVIDRISSRADDREAFHERDHVERNLLEFRLIARLFDQHILDTTKLSKDAALAHTMQLVSPAVLPAAPQG
jgi:dTMP kinase